MKRLALAGTVVLATFILGIFAVAVAQRDARNRTDVANTIRPEYSLQQPDPIAAHLHSTDDEVVTASNQVPPLDVPPPLSARSVVRANDGNLAPTNSLRAPGTQAMIPAPSLSPSPSEISPSPSMMPAPAFAPIASPGSSSANASLTSAYRGPQEAPGSPTSNGMPIPETLPNPTSFGAASTHPPSLQTPSLNANASTLPNPSIPNPTSSLPPATTQPGAGSNPISNIPSIAAPSSVGPPPAFSPVSNGYGNPTNTYAQSPTANPNGTPDSNASYPPNRSLRDVPQGSSPMNASPVSSQVGTQARLGDSDRDGNFRSSREGSLSDRPSSGSRMQTSGMQTTGMQTLSRPANVRPVSASFATLVKEEPGQRMLDGAQNPSLQWQKLAPSEVQVGQPATFTLILRNVGNAPAHEVTVIDRVPKGTRLSRTQPTTEPDANGMLVWSIGEMSAGAEQTIVVELIPETEGEIGSTASVTFASQASVRTVSTQPKLEISQIIDPKVLVGEMLNIRIQIANNGTGVARDIVLVEEVPQGLKHPKGPSMELEAFHLEPGDSRTIPLELLAVEPGMVKNVVHATSANTPPVESVVDVQVIAPELKIAMSGPKLRYLERQATYQINVTNSGTAIARNVDIVAYLPKGLRYNNAANEGEYFSDRHLVKWNLEELPAGQTAATELVVMPVEEGDFVLRVLTQGQDVRAEQVEKPVRVEGQSELAFTIEDDNDPIETDGFTTYVVKITNIGTRGDRNVQLNVDLPAGSEVLQVNGPVSYQATSNGILFEPLVEMRAKDQQVFRFAVRLGREGTQVVRANVKSQQRPVPVVKEESTVVYSDK